MAGRLRWIIELWEARPRGEITNVKKNRREDAPPTEAGQVFEMLGVGVLAGVVWTKLNAPLPNRIRGA